ncbi:hypothetical protein OPT61_g5102 [Boeremia exigua]|uniref:Uncharacterized protein n=1 Tax=Boeremia exigua TaxID=749465 RepID=A0ACC2IBT8_9PLEO|nr:hypothetical protein OPT61_g5102 [Boeremia exigua]
MRLEQFSPWFCGARYAFLLASSEMFRCVRELRRPIPLPGAPGRKAPLNSVTYADKTSQPQSVLPRIEGTGAELANESPKWTSN